MLGIHPSLAEARRLSFVKAEFLLFRNHHLHDNALWVYKPLTPAWILLFQLFLPQCAACLYTACGH